jgi:ferredoxin-NADP reductase
VPDALEWQTRSGSTMLRLPRPEVYEPGQYFFINIPAISLNEWHPFTASAVLDDSLIFYIKAMPRRGALLRPTNDDAHKAALKNENSPPDVTSAAVRQLPWTERVAMLARHPTVLPRVRLFGPFGHFEYTSYESLLLFAGGIGITPMIAIFTHLRARAEAGEDVGRLKNVVLVWMSRSVAEFQMFQSIFDTIAAAEKEKMHKRVDASKLSPNTLGVPRSHLTVPDSASITAHDRDHCSQQSTSGLPPRMPAMPKSSAASANSAVYANQCTFEIKLHCTRRESWAAISDPASADHIRMFVQPGRCDIPALFETYGHHTETLAAVCGPIPLAQAVSAEAWRFGTDFHSEEFQF